MTFTLNQIISTLLNADSFTESKPIDNYAVYPQTWPSSALGFGGIGGDMLTTAPTTAIESKGKVHVFFGSKLAYVRNVEDLPKEVYLRIFNLHDAPSLAEIIKLTNK